MREQLSNEANRGVAQLASASGLGPEGPVFESLYPDKKDDLRVILFFVFIILLNSCMIHSNLLLLLKLLKPKPYE